MRGFADSKEVVAPYKARILAILGAVILSHVAFLLAFWPHRWPASYRWLLLPDSMGAYFLLGLGLQRLKNTSKSELEAQKGNR
ncbi:MAG: hypothetical protein DMG81_20950 [Acidobacteria bacterium]|nr:MAG: hypothetical protein DMG81_20950 [Acidobacteriota bacterium]